jgi:hypothetical protein
MVTITDVVINDELKGLHPPMTPSRRECLVESIGSVGYPDVLIVNEADGTLVWGYLWYDIWLNEFASDPDNAPKIVAMRFEDPDSEKEFVLTKLLSQPNLNSAQRAQVALELKSHLAAKAKKNKKGRGKVLQKSDTLNVQRKLADLADVSHDTLNKVEKVLKSGNEQIVAEMLSEAISINAAYNAVLPLKTELSDLTDLIDGVEPVHEPSSTEASAVVHDPHLIQKAEDVPQTVTSTLASTNARVTADSDADLRPPNPVVDSCDAFARDRAVDDAGQRVSAITHSIHGIFKELPAMLDAIRAAAPANQNSLEELYERLYDEVDKAKATSIEMLTLWLKRDSPTPPANPGTSIDGTAVRATAQHVDATQKSPVRMTNPAQLANSAT